VRHVTFVLKTITETGNNGAAIIKDVVDAISDIVLLHPRWPELGSQWLEAFDKIDLAEVRKTAKASRLRPLKPAIAAILCLKLEEILGPSVLPRTPKAKREKPEPKRIRMNESHIALGTNLLELRNEISHSTSFGHAVRRQFDIDAKMASEAMAVARLYSDRPEIFTKLSWNALVTLACQRPSGKVWSGASSPARRSVALRSARPAAE
jgi:hypothetical protein